MAKLATDQNGYAPAGDPSRNLEAGPLRILFKERTALAEGSPLSLTVREFHVLAELASRRPVVVGREELHRAVWGADRTPGDRSVDVYVSKVRSKLEAAMPGWSFIDTHVGFGYCFVPRQEGA